MKTTILIIDDDITFQKAMAAKLESLTYRVLPALDGEDGLAKAVSEKPDLILLDIKMPKLDGFSLLKKFNANTDIPKIPVLITSNLSTFEQISEGVALGVRGYIIKSETTLGAIVTQIEAVLRPSTRK